MNFFSKSLAPLCIAVIVSQISVSIGAKENTFDLSSLFPKKSELLFLKTEESMAEAKGMIESILGIPDEERSFANTVKKLDELLAFSSLSLASNVVHVLEMVSPQESIRTAARAARLSLQEFTIDEITNNFSLFLAFKRYLENKSDKEDLTLDERYYLEEMIGYFKRKGFDLSLEKQEKIKQIEKDLGSLTLAFQTNIASCQPKIIFEKQDLKGVSKSFIDSLGQNGSGYEITVNAPNYVCITGHCLEAKTRERMYKAYMNRAYPENDVLLKKIIGKRDELANLMGFESYAAYDLANQMAKTPRTVNDFLDDLREKIKPKSIEEFRKLSEDLPFSVKKDEMGKLYPWDRNFIENQYKKKHLQIEESKIAEYFPLDITIKNILSIFETFFSLQCRLKKADCLWDEEVRLVEVFSKKGDRLLGCILLDLFPRPFKYGHACDINIIPATYKDSFLNVALSLVIANFPPPVGNKPALLQRSDLKTLFHEFGHALHDLLGRTRLASFSGTNVKMDFVEMPSQMLEEWIWDEEILKTVSSHYLTGEPLPDRFIRGIILQKNIFSALSLEQQLFFSALSLDLFGPGAEKDPYQIAKKLGETIRTGIAFSPDDHMYASFGHLTGYGAKYYGYIWSKVFALDLFSLIKKEGFFNPEIGDRYIKEVIGRGGSVDPNLLLERFLGKEGDNTAFLRGLGLIEK